MFELGRKIPLKQNAEKNQTPLEIGKSLLWAEQFLFGSFLKPCSSGIWVGVSGSQAVCSEVHLNFTFC